MTMGALAGAAPFPLAYFILNIDPILLQLGPLAIHWYGLAYVVAISVGLWFLLRWTHREGIHDDQTWTLFIWAAIAGLIGGRLYFVVQQPDLVSHYLLQPQNILAVWNGGMAFFGAIVLAAATLFVLAPRYGLSRFIVIDGGALFAAIGQIFGRFGNIINGDILGYAVSNGPVAVPSNVCTQSPCIAYVADPHILPWAIVYTNPFTFATPNVAFQPAPIYEMLMNLLILAILWPLRYKLPRIRAGLFFVLYLALYALSQFFVFFWRGSEPITPFLGIDVLKQAQWTGIILFLACIPLVYLVWRFSAPWPYSAKRPVPVQQGAGAAAAAQQGRSTTGRAAPFVVAPRSSSPLASGSTSVPEEAPAVDLPPWQPYRARRGELRNHFGPHANAGQTTTSH